VASVRLRHPATGNTTTVPLRRLHHATSLAPYVAAIEQIAADMRQQATDPVPARRNDRITLRELELRTDDESLDNLIDLDQALVARIVRRAGFEALRAALVALDAWIEGARASNAKFGYRDEDRPVGVTQFSADDIRRIVNSAAAEFGTVAPWRPESQP
jgi:hypothetical protein